MFALHPVCSSIAFADRAVRIEIPSFDAELTLHLLTKLPLVDRSDFPMIHNVRDHFENWVCALASYFGKDEVDARCLLVGASNGSLPTRDAIKPGCDIQCLRKYA